MARPRRQGRTMFVSFTVLWYQFGCEIALLLKLEQRHPDACLRSQLDYFRNIENVLLPFVIFELLPFVSQPVRPHGIGHSDRVMSWISQPKSYE